MTKRENEVTMLSVRLSAKLARRLKIECVRRDVSVQGAVAEAVAAWLKGGRP